MMSISLIVDMKGARPVPVANRTNRLPPSDKKSLRNVPVHLGKSRSSSPSLAFANSLVRGPTFLMLRNSK